jgi:hypothetical protein
LDNSFFFLGFELLWEISTYEESCLYKMKDGNTCFMRKDDNGKCHSLTICGTDSKHVLDEDHELWKQCEQLKIVILYMNKLNTLPGYLAKHFKDDIRLLCIMHNNFTEIPQDAYKFKKLEDLVMHGNYLSILPSDITKFSKLTKLYLGDNDLVCLPDVFDGLPFLKKASFCKNSLTRLPQSFSELRDLKSLDVSDNAIMTFPKCLLKLKSLIFLNFERNRIQLFTPTEKENDTLYNLSFTFFCQLSHFQIKGNPVCQHKHLKDIKSQNEVLKILKDKAKFQDLSEIEPTRSLRVIVLGESGGGKTSVVQAFTRGKYVIPTTRQGHRHTVGIDRYYYPVQIGDKTVLLHIWDHAGDDEYAMMNDLFITDDSLIWLVVNLDDYCPLDEEQNEDIFRQYIGHWLLEVMLHNLSPVVWILCTHTDTGHSNLKINHIRFWVDQLCAEVQKSLTSRKEKYCTACSSNGDQCRADVPQGLNGCIEIMELSNTYSFEGLNRLSEAFEELPRKYSSNFSNLLKPLPVEWRMAHNDLKVYAEKEFLLHRRIPTISADSEELTHILANRISLEEKDAFLEYLHDTGEIYRLLSSQEETLVLNVDWLINLFKEVYHLNCDKLRYARGRKDFKEVTPEMIKNCSSMRKDRGLIVETILKALWKCTDHDQLFAKIISLFEDFNLTYTVITENSNPPQKFYFFPYLTKSNFPSESNSQVFRKSHITLQFISKFFFPKFFLQRLALQFWQNDRNTMIYSDGFKTTFENGMHLHITRMNTSSESPYTEGLTIFLFSADTIDVMWSKLLTVFEQIHSILLSYWKFCGDADVFVACPKCIIEQHLPCNTIRLTQFSEDLKMFQYRNVLYCSECRGQTFIRELTPPPELKISEICHFVSFNNVVVKKDFIDKLTSWKVPDPQMDAPSTVPSNDSWLGPPRDYDSYHLDWDSTDVFERPVPVAD